MERFKFLENKGLMMEGRLIADFDVRVAKLYRCIEENGEKEEIEYELVASTLDGKVLQPRRVKKINNLSYFTLWSEIMDAGLDNWERRMLNLRLQESCQKAVQINEYRVASNGFHTLDKGKRIFVAGDMCFKMSPSDDFIEREENIIKMGWNSKITKDWKKSNETVEDYLLVSPGTSEILFVATLLAAIKGFFVEAGFNPAVCLNLYGKTGSYKTSLIQTMMYMTNPVNFMCSLVNDQKKNAVKKVKECYGFPVVLEDYHPAATGYDYRRQISMIDAVVRHIESNSKSAVVFITSEFLDGVESLQARTLQIETQPVDLEILTRIQHSGKLANIIYCFLSALIEKGEEVFQEIRQKYDEINPHGKEILRIDESRAFLIITAYLFEKYVNDKENGDLYEKLNLALDMQRKKQILHMEQLRMSEKDRVIITVSRMIDDETLYKTFTFEERQLYKGEKDQVYLNNTYLFLNKVAIEYGLEKYGDEKMNAKRVISVLSEADILKEDSGTHTTKVQGIRSYCIFLPDLKRQYDAIMEKK